MADKVTSTAPTNHVIDTSLTKDISMTLTKQEWIIIFNVLVRKEYLVGDAAVVSPIIHKIEPLVVPTVDKDLKEIK